MSTAHLLWWPHSFLLAFTALFLFHSLGYATELKEEKRVQIFLPNQSDLPAYPMVEKGIKAGLAPGTEFHIEYFVEHMDFYRNADKTYNRSIKIRGWENPADKPSFRPNSRRFT